MNAKTTGNVIRVIGVLAVIGFFYSIQVFLPDFYSTMWRLTVEGDLEGLTHYIYSFGVGAFLASIFMVAFANAIGIPSIPFLTVNGVIFGLIPGILISWVGEVLGIEISFRLTRTLLRNQAKKIIEKNNKLEKLDSYSCVKTIMFARAIPYSPNVVVTALSAVSHITYKDHFIANVFGKIPAVVVEVWLGHDLLLIREHWDRLIVLVLVVSLVYGFLWWRRKHRPTPQPRRTTYSDNSNADYATKNSSQ